MSDAITKLQQRYMFDCGDNSCKYATHRTGMRTNGGCHCHDHRRYRQYVGDLEHLAKSQQAEIERLREALATDRKAAVDEFLGAVKSREGEGDVYYPDLIDMEEVYAEMFGTNEKGGKENGV